MKTAHTKSYDACNEEDIKYKKHYFHLSYGIIKMHTVFRTSFQTKPQRLFHESCDFRTTQICARDLHRVSLFFVAQN